MTHAYQTADAQEHNHEEEESREEVSQRHGGQRTRVHNENQAKA